MPRQEMSFKDPTHEFRHDVIPASGSSRTIFAKSILDREGILFQTNVDNEELFNASNNPITVMELSSLLQPLMAGRH